MREWSLSGIGVRIPGPYNFSTCLGHLQKFYVSFHRRDVALCLRAGGGLLYAKGFFACKESFAITKWKLLFGRTLGLVQTSELSRWVCFQTRSPDVFTSARMRWMSPAGLHFVYALSKMNCRADKFFTSRSCQGLWITASFRAQAQSAEAGLPQHHGKCQLRDRLWQAWTCTGVTAQSGRGDNSHTAPWTALRWFCPWNFSLRKGTLSAQRCWRWEEGFAPSELLVGGCHSKSL